MHNVELEQLPALLGCDILGDPHLGRDFKTGVPLHRLGEREASQMSDFAKSLIRAKNPIHVCLGDLFDKFRVSNEVVLSAATAYEVAAAQNPTTQYIVLQGNHDNSKDNNKVSSFSIFERMVSHITNIHVLTGSPLLIDNKLFIPWTPFDTAEQSVESFIRREGLPSKPISAVFAHWDVNDYGNEDATHVVPLKSLSKLTDLVVLGHYHKPSLNSQKGLTVACWGSMQPYAHGEEAGEPEQYLSHSREVVEENLATNDEYYKYKNLRVLLDAHEQPMAGIECLALTHKRIDVKSDLALDVNVDEFSLQSVFTQTFEEFGIDKSLTTEIFNKI